MTLTSDFPPSVVAARSLALELGQGGGSSLQLVAEPGFSVTGEVADLAEVTISGQDFGARAPQRHFDRIDRCWANGTEFVPYAGVSEGDQVPVGDGYPFLNSLVGLKMRSEAARPGRALGYQFEFQSGSCSTNGGFAGWPSSQADSEEVYLRYWRYQRYFGTDGDVDPEISLASSLGVGATSANIGQSVPALNNSVGGLEELYIELDNGDLHYCIQQTPLISESAFNFSPALPSPASAGNRVYRRKNTVNKNVRMRDGNDGPNTFNAYTFSGFQGQISNDKWSLVPGKPQARWEAGEWELHEYYIRAPKEESRLETDYIKRVRINGVLRMDLQGRSNIAEPGALYDPPQDGWPSGGLAVTNFGHEEDRTHQIPNNQYRFSDIYVDGDASQIGVRRRVEIGIGNDNLYLCPGRECCPIQSWDGSITIKLNALPFTSEQMAQARIFVVDEDDNPTLVARIQ
ncbi:hypothetical protein [Marinobacter shengliensis]|uniref:Uncharacterized protein n=1 Tax=Marinobacter shengliensis TaxID=1389223 RepID=A0ABV4WBW9_9GAMM